MELTLVKKWVCPSSSEEKIISVSAGEKDHLGCSVYSEDPTKCLTETLRTVFHSSCKIRTAA